MGALSEKENGMKQVTAEVEELRKEKERLERENAQKEAKISRERQEKQQLEVEKAKLQQNLHQTVESTSQQLAQQAQQHDAELHKLNEDNNAQAREHSDMLDRMKEDAEEKLEDQEEQHQKEIGKRLMTQHKLAGLAAMHAQKDDEPQMQSDIPGDLKGMFEGLK